MNIISSVPCPGLFVAFCLQPLFRHCWGRSLSSRSAMLGTSQVDPICMFHRGSWTSSSREKIFSYYQSGLGAEPLTRRQILPFFLHLSGPRHGSQKVFQSTVWECRSALTASADTVALLVLSKTLCSPRHHSLLPKGRERGRVTLFNRAWTTNYITKHSTKLIIQGTSRMWYKWCKCVNSE